MIESPEDAGAVGLAYLQEHVEPEVGEPIGLTSVRDFPTCWVVGYNTVTFIETGALSHALAGGPVIINRSSVRFGWDDQIYRPRNNWIPSDPGTRVCPEFG